MQLKQAEGLFHCYSKRTVCPVIVDQIFDNHYYDQYLQAI